MIKLELKPKPEKLTDALVKSKTEKYKADNTQLVWNIDWLKAAIADLSFGKCCYTEIRLGEESKYMEIEHFHPKSRYPDEVLLWGNLLPSCKKCNAMKGEHDTIEEPVVNPFADDPKDFFYMENGFYRVKNNSDIAKRTIKKLGLNDIEHFVKPRNRIYEKINEKLADLKEDILVAPDEKLLTYARRLKRLMKEGNRQEEYAALVSTTILSSPDFTEIENYLIVTRYWDEECDSLKNELQYCSLMR